MRLIDADALMKNVEDKYPTDNYEFQEMIKNAPTLLGWIDCDERLPEDGVLVITLIYGHDVITVNEGETLKEALERISHYARTSVGFYSEEDGGWCTSDGYPEICTPRFWMPIPEPPEEGENT